MVILIVIYLAANRVIVSLNNFIIENNKGILVIYYYRFLNLRKLLTRKLYRLLNI